MTQGETANLTDALVELSFLIQATLARVAGEHELSLAQVRLIGILRDREPGIVELASVLNLDKSSVSGLVDRAQTRGLVSRSAAAGADGRAIRVLLTPLGHARASEFAQQVTLEIERLTAPLTPAQRERLARAASLVVRSSGIADGLERPRGRPPSQLPAPRR